MSTEPFEGLLGPLPQISIENQAFWTGGFNGRLLITRCQQCGWWIHPPAPSCRRCRSLDVRPEAASGRGRIYSFTVNHQPWFPGQRVPFVVAIVELEEQRGLRLTTQLLNEPQEVSIGAPAEVRFQAQGDVWLPLFVQMADG